MKDAFYMHKVKWCPFCDQGWVEIVKEIETGILFCYCNECETEWDNPEYIAKDKCNYPEKYGKICEATDDEIKEKGWNNYIIK